MSENGMYYNQLDSYWKKHEGEKRVSEQLALKASDIFNNSRKHKNILIVSVMQGCGVFLCGILAMLCEQIENSQRKKILSRLLNIRKDEIAVDENDLLKKKWKIRCYGNDFTYSVVVAKDYLKNIEVILGDAHLEALDDIDCLGNLKKVTGEIYYQKKEG